MQVAQLLRGTLAPREPCCTASESVIMKSRAVPLISGVIQGKESKQEGMTV